MNLRHIRAMIAHVADSGSRPGKTLARSGIVLVHIAAVGLATAILPILSCVVAIVGMALYMIGARRTMQAAESRDHIFRA